MELFELGQKVYVGRPPHFLFSVGDKYYEGYIIKVLSASRRLPVRYVIDFPENDRATSEKKPQLVPH